MKTRNNASKKAEEENSVGSNSTTANTEQAATMSDGTDATTCTEATTCTDATTDTNATTTDTNATTTDSNATEPAPGSSRAGDLVGSSGIKATPAASIATVTERRPSGLLMPPPPASTRTLKPARSHRTKASSKRLLAELETKERLAELELKRIQAEAELARIRQERMNAESSREESEEEEDDLAPTRVAEWFDRRPEEAAIDIPAHEEQRGNVACASTRLHRRQERHEEAPTRSAHAVDVSSLTAALTEAIQASRSTKKFLSELPGFSGLSSEWLQFKAAYNESSSSFSLSENVARIRRSLKGVAWEAVSALLISQPHPDDVIAALERRYGRPDALLISEIEKMKGLPRLNDNPRDLCIFASRIANTVATIEILRKPQYLYNPEALRTIVDKLTPILRNKWYDYAATREDTPELKKIAEFLNKEADKCAPYAPPEYATEHKEAKAARRKPERAYAATAEPERKKEEKLECPLCQHSSHHLHSCPSFKKLDTNERWETAKKYNVCYRCLASKHRRLTCRAQPCGHQGCTMKHHRLLHHERPQTDAATSGGPPPSKIEGVVASAVEQVAGAASRATKAYLKIAPVTLRGPRTAIDAFALLDEGSTVTIIDAALADTLGLDGPTEPMWVQGVSGKETAHKRSKRVDLHIRSRHGGGERRIFNAHTVNSLDFTTQSVGRKEIEDCAHLKEIESELIYNSATPKILIGQDNWELIVSREIRKGRRDQLVASKTELGWVLHGCRTSNAEPVAYCCAHLTRLSPTDKMEEMMKQYFALESLSIEPRKQKSDPELQALKLLDEKSRRLPDGRFETGLLWRNEAENIPNNRASALKRLHTLERKLDRDEKLKQQYNERVNNLLTSSYAERAATLPTQRTWYLPHFAVCNPEKPKIRLVHDAAATSHGRSLNDMLLPGPDFLQSLPGVMMRFRQHSIAVSADIKEMFMQIKIRKEDRDALRFLWRGDRREGEPEEYSMTSVIFGASSSPCTALYIKNRNAREHADEFPEAAAAIERNHYMDDYLQSFPALDEARRVTRDVDHVHRQAGFQLRGWATNVRKAITDIVGGEEREGNTVPIGGSEIEKTLGLLWDTHEDSVRFRLNTRRAPPEVLDDLRPPTKRKKRWIALFTCMTSRAVHLEIVTSLSADAAINALRRFIARRGCPTELWSDNATAFRGADRELTEATRDAANARRINWRFLPPAAPFMAGAWKRMVRTVKEAMRATLREKCPSEETLRTLLAEAEATVNSRPLTYVPVTPDDPPALTPNMILLGPDCYSPAPGSFDESDDNARQHWRRAQRLADTFWRRWVREYTPVLQQRREPRSAGTSPAVGDIVVVCDSNLPRNTWPRGRVTRTYPGKDGVVRVVDVLTSRGHTLRRPTKKIVVLPVNSLSDGGRNVRDD